MKRSEMVALIAMVMEEGFDADNGSWEEDAGKVLDAIEEAGMMPPQNGNNYDSGGSGDDYFCIATPTYEWDKETKRLK